MCGGGGVGALIVVQILCTEAMQVPSAYICRYIYVHIYKLASLTRTEVMYVIWSKGILYWQVREEVAL